MDFWRFWVVHLWVEDFLELFTTIMVAYIDQSSNYILVTALGSDGVHAVTNSHFVDQKL